MPNFLTITLMCLLMGATVCQAAEKQAAIKPQQISPEDLKVVAVMEILQLMELTEDIDMVKDINYLIEDGQNDSQTD